MRVGKWFAAFAALAVVAGLAACDSTALAPRKTSVTPQERPAAPAPAPKPVVEAPVPAGPSPASKELASYYSKIESGLLIRGLLRTDGGGPDTVYTDTMLARNFENIALKEEYERSAGLVQSQGRLGRIKKWVVPVRMTTEFGPGISAEQMSRDTGELKRYVTRLGRITGHPITMSDANPNFFVIFTSTDDMPAVADRIRAIVPDLTASALSILADLPRDVQCFVYAFSETPEGNNYDKVVAVIRSEHPELLRRACIHEEVAQGFGLSNDDPRARPSIFNDDDEFALLTTHDEMLLKILYDPRLRPGMTAEEARPIVTERATALVGGSS